MRRVRFLLLLIATATSTAQANAVQIPLSIADTFTFGWAHLASTANSDSTGVLDGPMSLTATLDTNQVAIVNANVALPANIGPISLSTNPVPLVETIRIDPAGFDPPFTVQNDLGDVQLVLDGLSFSAVSSLPALIPLDPISLNSATIHYATISMSANPVSILLDGTEIASVAVSTRTVNLGLQFVCTDTPAPDCTVNFGAFFNRGWVLESARVDMDALFPVQIPPGDALVYRHLSVQRPGARITVGFFVPKPGVVSLVAISTLGFIVSSRVRRNPPALRDRRAS